MLPMVGLILAGRLMPESSGVVPPVDRRWVLVVLPVAVAVAHGAVLLVAAGAVQALGRMAQAWPAAAVCGHQPTYLLTRYLRH